MAEKKNKIKVAAALQWMKSRIWKDPEALRQEIRGKIIENTAQLEQLTREEAQAYKLVCQKKPEYEKAPAARKDVLKAELTRLISRHTSLKNQLDIVGQNEILLQNALVALDKATAYKERLSAEQVDQIIDQVERAAEKADLSGLAADDLKRVGDATIRVTPSFDVDDVLDEYGDPETAAEPEGLDGFEAPDEEVASDPVPQKAEPEQEP